MRNYNEGRWEPQGLNAGKFCEIAFCVVEGFLTGIFPAKANKPANFVDACRALERRAPGAKPGDRACRILIPRVLCALYEVRNNRGVGHVGGEVDPSHMDAAYVLASTKWVTAEFVRIFGTADTAAATAAVETLSERQNPVVWDTGSGKRVLVKGMIAMDRALVLLYDSGRVAANDLAKWSEYSSPADFRSKVLKKAHREQLLDYDAHTQTVEITPVGAKHVEDQRLLEPCGA